MAVTETTILILSALATLSTIGMFLNFADRWTELLVTFTAAVLWGVLGWSSFDVIVRDTSFATASEPITPLVYVGFGFAAVIFLYGITDLLTGVKAEVRDTDMDEMLR